MNRNRSKDTYWYQKANNKLQRISVSNMEYTHIEAIRRKILNGDRQEWFGKSKENWVEILESELKHRNSMGNSIISALDKVFPKSGIKKQFKSAIYDDNRRDIRRSRRKQSSKKSKGRTNKL